MPTPRAYYNEFDVKAAAWLRELIKAGHIAPGDVDTRSIADVAATDLKGYAQCHFFAGIGGWSYALRLAGWPDDRPVWTGSCPCQPFSAAGKRGGTDDARHLWPEFYRLIREHRPATVFGEQVASKDGLAWLDIVSADLERADYAVGAADMCAAGVGAPHIRQRLYFVADSGCTGSLPSAYAGIHCGEESGGSRDVQPERCGATRELAHPNMQRKAEPGHRETNEGWPADGTIGNRADGSQSRGESRAFEPSSPIDSNVMAHTNVRQREQSTGSRARSNETPSTRAHSEFTGRSDASDVFSGTYYNHMEHAASDRQQQWRPESGERRVVSRCWQDVEYIPCTDGKARPIESGTFPLAHGIPHRVGLLRGYGNAIVPQVAAEFIGAYLGIVG